MSLNLSDDLACKAFKTQRRVFAFYKTVISPQAGEVWGGKILNNQWHFVVVEFLSFYMASFTDKLKKKN